MCPQSEGSWDAHETWRRNHSQKTATKSINKIPHAMTAVLLDIVTTFVVVEFPFVFDAIVIVDLRLLKRGSRMKVCLEILKS